MLTNLKSVLVDEDGATLVEYALVVALIAIACIGTVTALGSQIKTAFTDMACSSGMGGSETRRCDDPLRSQHWTVDYG